jgi:PAS domain S-box-containing protein
MIDLVVMLVGGFAWGGFYLLLGLGFPLGILGINALIQTCNFALFKPTWWIQIDRPTPSAKNITEAQVVVLLFVVTLTATASWFLKAGLDGGMGRNNNDLFVVFLMSASLVAIAIACWTTLPQLAALEEAREESETRLITALDTVPDTILVLTPQGIIKQTNPSAEALFQFRSEQLVGKLLSHFLPKLESTPAEWAIHSEHDLMIAPAADQEYPDYRTVEATISQRSNYMLEDCIVILRDITDRKRAEQILQQSEATLKQQTTQLQETLSDLQQTQLQLIQTEKMSGLGQMVAGVAHEINNPVNFIHGNVNHVRDYSLDLLGLMELYLTHYPHPVADIEQRIQDIDLDFLQEDLPKLLNSMQEGTRRIREIVLSLRNFSRLDEAEMKHVDIHEGIDSTLLILQNRLKEKPGHRAIQVHKQYGNLPLVECHAGQINQVFMNILTNAIDAIEDHRKKREHPSDFERGAIAIATQIKNAGWVAISITDNGSGIPHAIQTKLFDPFFTTKAIGSGTGLGLSISYQIIIEQHGGKLSCTSSPENGTTFLIEIPIKPSVPLKKVGI